MSIIAVCEKRKLTLEEFKNCWEWNYDGFGVAYIDELTCFTKGFMSMDEAYRFYDGVPCPHVCHFMTATGTVTKFLTQPFIISTRSELTLCGYGFDVMFHEGTISNWRELYITHCLTQRIPAELYKLLNDSRVMAMIASVDERILDLYNDSYFVIMDRVGRIKGHEYFIEENGVFFSNTGYMSLSKRNYNKIHYGIF